MTSKRLQGYETHKTGAVKVAAGASIGIGSGTGIFEGLVVDFTRLLQTIAFGEECTSNSDPRDFFRVRRGFEGHVVDDVVELRRARFFGEVVEIGFFLADWVLFGEAGFNFFLGEARLPAAPEVGGIR
jgi:hypothetical protein